MIIKIKLKLYFFIEKKVFEQILMNFISRILLKNI